jgi:hypothetical protein
MRSGEGCLFEVGLYGIDLLVVLESNVLVVLSEEVILGLWRALEDFVRHVTR